jgi:regulator of sirC expression with transglutaminase-like and TPR domain
VDPTTQFASLLQDRRDGVPLDQASLLIAECAEPGLDPQPALATLDELAGTCPGYTLDALLPHLFGPGRFAPNTDDYYDPRNSFLNHVLERHVGIPITLAVVALEVGRRVGVPLAGVGMPGHFLLQDKVDRDVFIDPFDRGRVLDREGCRRLFLDVVGADATWSDDYLEAVGNVSIISRLLNNLRAIYEARRDLVNLRWVMGLRAALPEPYGDDPDEFARSMAPLN